MTAVMTPPQPVVLAHDWLNGMRGGERVLELLCREFPEAELYTLLHKPGAVSQTIESHPIHTSFLQHLPGIQSRYRYTLPLFPLAARGLRARDAELIISTSHCVAKAVRGHRSTRHLCYCFTPMRYAWTFYEEYFGSGTGKKILLKPLLAALRRWDRDASEHVDRFVAISHHIRKRIHTYYGRDADVIYPPVDTDRCTPNGRDPEDFDLIVSALVPYKRIDLAVEAYTRLGTPLKIIGTGTEYEALRAAAGPHIEFKGWQSDDDVTDAYRRCRALVFPGEEDFGIVPVEAQACGRPVIAFGRGGALETVRDRETGVFFPEQTPEALLQAVEKSHAIPWNPTAIRHHAETFSADRFLREIRIVIDECLDP